MNLKKNKSIVFLTLLMIMVITFGYGVNSVVNVKTLHAEELFESFTSKSVLLIHADSGEVLFAKNENSKLQVASISKLMTTLITLEKIEGGKLSLDDMFLTSNHAASMEGSQAFLDAGSKYSVKELLKSLIVASANDSAVVLAEGIAGSEEKFTKLMNTRAMELGMSNTRYANSSGLSAAEQYSTAIDTSIILKELNKYEVFKEDSKIWMDKLIHPSGRETELVNTNRLIRYYDYVVNGKTGYTDEAGHCLASYASKANFNLIAVTLNASSSSNRFKENVELLTYGFANFENKQIFSVDEPLEFDVLVMGGKINKISVKPESNVYVVSKKYDDSSIEFNFEINNKLKAPVKENQIVGKAIITNSGKVIGEVNIISCQTVNKQSYLDSIIKIINNWKIKNN